MRTLSVAHRAEQTQQVLTEIKPFLLIWPQVTLVSFAAVIRVVTQRSSPVGTLITAAKETNVTQVLW